MMHPTRNCKSTTPGNRRAPGLLPIPHHSLEAGDRADRQFASVVLVDGYQPFKIGDTPVIAVTAYPQPCAGPVEEPPFDVADYLLCQFAVAGVDNTPHGLVWLCDVSFELHPATAYLLAGRIDRSVARRMRTAEFILVLDVPTTSDWTMDNVCLKLPNVQDMWAKIPEFG